MVAACLALALGGVGACRAGAPPPPAAPSPSATTSAVGSATSTSAPSLPTPIASAPAAPAETAIAPPAPPPRAGSTKVIVKTDPAWAACHRAYDPKKKDPSKDVEAMAKACAKATKMTLAGKTLTGKQGDQDPPQTFPLTAEANHCYRVYAQASEGIRDLDLAIKDSTGAVAGEDGAGNANPVVVEDGAVCFKEADSATIVVSVGLGKGSYALQVWKD